MKLFKIFLIIGVILLLAVIAAVALVPDLRQVVASLWAESKAPAASQADLKSDGERLAAAIWMYRQRHGAMPERLTDVSVQLLASLLEKWTYAPSSNGFVLHIYTGHMREMLVGEWQSPGSGTWEVSPDD